MFNYTVQKQWPAQGSYLPLINLINKLNVSYPCKALVIVSQECYAICNQGMCGAPVLS